MKIKRTIDGKEYEFELEPQERYEAWRECDIEMKRAEVKYYKEQYMDYNPDITEEEVDEALDDILERYIEILDEADNWTMLERAYEWVLE